MTIEGFQYSIRNAQVGDADTINALCSREDMCDVPSLEHVYVAVDAQDEILGFIRIRVADDGRAFVNPIITCAHTRGMGVGRALMEHARTIHGDLYLVARGKATGFYRALGLQDIPWNQILFDLTEDCEHCTVVQQCCPQPMKWPVPDHAS